jgi:mannitol-1-/sugar-/sorbitol-6-phosphatase
MRVNPAPQSVPCRAILFDLDGVLASSIPAVERAWRAWAARVGLDGDALLRVVHGRRAVDTLRAVAPSLDLDAELAWLEHRESTDVAGVEALPGAAELLARLPVSRWAVVTSGSRPVARARLRAAGLREPAAFITAEDLTRGKPDPEGYLAAAARLGVPPAECLVVEDAPAGAAAARAAGMRLVALTTTHPADDFPDADLVVPTLAALTVDVPADAEAEGGAPLTVAAAEARAI